MITDSVRTFVFLENFPPDRLGVGFGDIEGVGDGFGDVEGVFIGLTIEIMSDGSENDLFAYKRVYLWDLVVAYGRRVTGVCW